MKLKLHRHLKKRTILSWLISYLLILIIPILFVGLSYIYIGVFVEQKITEINYNELSNAGVHVDDILENIVNISSELMNDDDIERLTQYKLPLNTEDMLEVAGLESIWSNYASVNQYTEDMYIYMPNTKQIFSSKKMYSVDDYFELNYSGKTQEIKNAWIESILLKQKSGYTYTESDGSVFYVQPNIVNKVEDVPYSIIIKLNMEALMHYGTNDMDNNFFICSSSGSLIAGEDSENEKLLMLQTADYGNSRGTYKINGEKYILAKIKSQNANWYYTSITLSSEYFYELNTIYLIMLVAIMLSLLCGVVAIRWSMKRNNKPLKELYNFFAKSPEQKFNDIDVYKYINSELIKIINEKNLYKDELASQKDILKRDILSNLVEGKVNESYSYEKQVQIAHIDHDGDLYIALVFYIDDVDRIFFGDISDTKEAAATAKYIVSNIASELIGNSFNIEIFENHGLLVGVMSVENEDEFSAVYILTDIITELTDFIKKEFNFRVAVSVSDIHYSLNGISEAYSEAVIGAEYLMSSGETLIRYSDIKTKNNNHYIYTNETEQQILNLLEESEYKKCRMLVDSVLENCTRVKETALWITRYIAYDLLNTFLKMAIKFNNKELIDIVRNSGNTISQCITTKEILSAVKSMSENFIEEIENTEMENSVTSIYKKIKIYVDNNYDNPDLNGNNIADVFSMNPSVLSTQFKKAWNIGLADYINNKRVEKAKMLLAKSDKKVNEIAALAGFSNYRTFHRVFQKAEQVSPTKWREMYKSE